VTLGFRAGPDAGVVLGNPTILERAETAIPPVVIICIDTLRRDHVDPYRRPGDDAELLTPALASLAQDGIVFERAVASSSWTLPSVASLMTGLAPSVHQAGRRVTVESNASFERFRQYHKVERGFVRFFDGDIYRMSRLRSDVDTLAELLRHSHLTHASNSNISLSQVGNVLNQGFDSHFYQSTLAAAEVTSTVLDFARAHANAQLFLYAHYIDPHEWPYRKIRGRQETDRERARSAYQLLVKEVDREVGALLDGLRELGLYDSALVVFYADHGEHFWDDASQKLHGHGHTMHHIAIEVPLLVKFPGGALAGTVVDAPVKLADVYATVLEATAIAAPEQGAYDLRSLRAAAAGTGDDPSPRRIVAEYNAKGVELASILLGEHKAILDRKNGYWQMRLAATDEILDPHSEGTTELFERLRGALREHDAWGKRHGTVPEAIKVTAEEMENLRQLGYIQGEADAPVK
jgi:arylsulfatase A-like enzyme